MVALRRNYIFPLVVVSVVAIGMAKVLSKPKSPPIVSTFPVTTNSHPGTIVDAVTGYRIQAYATAYGSNNKKGNKGDCPYFDQILQETISAPGSGDFVFLVDATKTSFTAVYCQGGYAFRTVPANDNSRNGERSQPDPITLYPNQQTLSQRRIKASDAAYIAMGRVLYSAKTNVYYFSQADDAAFGEALKRFSPQDQTILLSLRSAGSEAVPYTLK